jgi:heat shock protein HtpX
MFLRVTFWGAGGASRGGLRGGAVPAIVMSLRIAAILAPIFARLVAARCQPPARVPRGCLERSSSRATRPVWSGPWLKIAPDQEALEVANRATQHLYIVKPIKKLRGRRRACVRPTRRSVDRINRLRR